MLKLSFANFGQVYWKQPRYLSKQVQSHPSGSPWVENFTNYTWLKLFYIYIYIYK